MRITRPVIAAVCAAIAVVLLTCNGAFGQSAPPEYHAGEHVSLTEDTPLFFNLQIYRKGLKGEVFKVLYYKAETNRLWVSAKDANGREIGLNLPATEVWLLPDSPNPPKPGAATPTPAVQTALNAEATARVTKATYLVTTDLGQGSAFLVALHGQVYLVTNYHVLKGASTIECANQFDSFKITDGPIEVADDRDLVRIPMDKKDALEINPNVTTDDGVAAFGNSGGKDVVTKLDGKVLGVGPQELEVSCEFIPGNSGGPIADSQGKVAGIATYVARAGGIPDWVKQGTRFEATRRFGVRLTDDILWSKTTLAQFQVETKTLATMDGMFDDFLNIARNIAVEPFEKRLSVKDATDDAVMNLVNSYNIDVQAVSAKSGHSATEVELDTLNREYHGRVRTYLANLVRAINEDSASLSLRYQKAFTVPHTKTESSQILSDMKDLATYLDKHSDDIVPKALFHMERPSPSPGSIPQTTINR